MDRCSIVALDDQGVNAMVGEAKRGREAYDAASYDQDWNLYFGGHGGWAFDTKDTKGGRLLVMEVMEAEDYSNSGGVSRLCMYSSAAQISLRQGCRLPVPLSDASFPTSCLFSETFFRIRQFTDTK